MEYNHNIEPNDFEKVMGRVLLFIYAVMAVVIISSWF
jgi:hypothetical protein